MQLARRNVVVNYHSPWNKPQLTVEPGEVFAAETELCTGDWLHSPDDEFTPDKTAGCNPTVVIAVRGAQPGDALRVHVLDIKPEPQGYTGFWRDATLPYEIIDYPWENNLRTVRIEDGHVLFNDKLRLPVRPMIGTLGTAPAEGSIYNSYGGVHGGNMDVQEVAIGAAITLPVAVEGALLHIGDVHAMQGDGEICGSGGIECASVVTLKVEVIARPRGMKAVRIEDDTHIAAVSCEPTLDASFNRATEEMLKWMTFEYGFTMEEAYLLCAQLMEVRITQMVNPTRSVIAKMPKAYLIR